MKYKRLFLRGEGGGNLGMGHIMRLYSVWQNLSELPFQSVTYVTLSSQIELHGKLKELGIKPSRYKSEIEFFEDIDSYDVVVVDYYEYDSQSLKAIKEKGALLIYIDDTQHTDLSKADIVINHTPSYERKDFKLSDSSLLLIGPKYCMIRKEFIQKKSSRVIKSIRRIVFSLGMSNSGGLFNDILGLLKENLRGVKFEIIPGVNRFSKDLISDSDTIHNNLTTSEIIELFDACDLGVFPTSTLYMEGLSRGMLVAGGYFVENQKAVYNKLIHQDLIFRLGDFRELKAPVLQDLILRVRNSLPMEIKIEYGEGWRDVRNAINKCS